MVADPGVEPGGDLAYETGLDHSCAAMNCINMARDRRLELRSAVLETAAIT